MPMNKSTENLGYASEYAEYEFHFGVVDSK